VRARAAALLALALPVLAGLLFLWRFDAPPTYLAVNAGALGLGALIILLPVHAPPRSVARVLTAMALAALFLPLVTGPELSSVARWVPLGPFTLHVGSLFVPALVVLAARDEEHAPLILAIALFGASLQPDMATGAALMLAGVGFYLKAQDLKYAVFVIVAFFASIVMALHGELPAQPFVERVIIVLVRLAPLAALGLLASLLASFFLILHTLPGGSTARRALAGSLFGFSLAAVLSNYPSVLIGYGAAPILGYALGLALLVARRDRRAIRV
jgi:hypothetical protein